ncbi:restriction endonuclease [Pseudoxanthomonas yeongjuensis]|uniref:restriction endonuclease n=1 Tax=Pseudoxanthomonas yeongjuensis TaxID=377616 RepID=UPI001390900B|nr:restriction endonuclease [Pseudoxanthomonas yeongjuensis]KAF1714460.1 restriction endonuclease [Pseudoxanthomonas yeongjuensis]
MARMWMVRGEGGSLYEKFRDQNAVAVGWSQLAGFAKPGVSRAELIEYYKSVEPQFRAGTIISGASQVWRFVNEIQIGDGVVTYSPSNRSYLVGTITGAPEHKPEWADEGMPLIRSVQWRENEVPRDSLGLTTKNSLGSTLTVFLLPPSAMNEMLGQVAGAPVSGALSDTVIDEEIIDSLADIEQQAIERIKDLVNELSWENMQHLVAGILRAMGYKTQVSLGGADRGKDIVASPDGFGFEHPRIVVEVKHRRSQMGSPEIRSFLGGRHKDDRGLYVSTGGFSKDALYEADRAAIPLSLWTLDNVVRALTEHYDATDAETKRLVPLKRTYWPA